MEKQLLNEKVAICGLAVEEQNDKQRIKYYCDFRDYEALYFDYDGKKAFDKKYLRSIIRKIKKECIDKMIFLDISHISEKDILFEILQTISKDDIIVEIINQNTSTKKVSMLDFMWVLSDYSIFGK